MRLTAGCTGEKGCFDASGPATISRGPMTEEWSPIAAPTPQPKSHGKDSPALPLRPSHLFSPVHPAAIFIGNSTPNAVQLC